MIFCKEDHELLQGIADTLSPKDAKLIFVENGEMGGLNLEYRSKNKNTGVLSFPLQAINEIFPLGSTVVNKTLAREKAEEFHYSLKDKISLLFIHAILHPLGFDHGEGRGEMRQKEEELIRLSKLPQSLIAKMEAL